MKSCTEGGDFGGCEGIASFQSLYALLRLLALTLVELWGYLWLGVGRPGVRCSFVSRCEDRTWRRRAGAGLDAVIFLQLSELAEEHSQSSVALVVSSVETATSITVVGLAFQKICQLRVSSHASILFFKGGVRSGKRNRDVRQRISTYQS